MKGKGEMETYFVVGKKIERSKSFGKSQYAHNNSLAAVLSAMVQVRKKQALGSSLSVPSPRPRITPGLSSLSFNFRKPRSPHKLHRMLSEVHSSGSARSKRHRLDERRMTETGAGSHSFPDMSVREGSAKRDNNSKDSKESGAVL